MKFARIINNVAVEVFTPPAGVAIAQCFHPEIASQFQHVPDDVTANSTRDSGGVWTIAIPPEEPAH